MNLDYFVYSRGVEQKDGVRIRHAPSYITGDVINGCQAFLRFVKTKGAVTGDAYEWNNTFMYIPLKDYNCCLLVRAVRIEDYETGQYINDFQNRQTWSLEGVCCPYSRARYFFALLPSILTYMKMNERNSLHTLMTTGHIGDVLELPDDMIYNAVSDMTASYFPGFREIVENRDETIFVSALNSLADMIHNADEPFSFVFGTLSKLIYDGLGRGYKLKSFISTREDEYKSETLPDNFHLDAINIRETEMPLSVGKKTEYVLRIKIKPDYKNGGSYFWSVGDKSNMMSESVLVSDPIKFNMETGLSVSKLLAEANCIRDMAISLGWEVQLFSKDDVNNYIFVKTD